MDTLHEPGEAFQPNMHLVAHPVGMIFQEIESNGGEVVSVSENIDNCLTGKLIRSILAWSAESEREKIAEYANRHWQKRHELGLPMATTTPPYGWQWGNKDKTFYELNMEEAAVRLSIFEMFVELDMSIRQIGHKLTIDGIPTPREARKEPRSEQEELDALEDGKPKLIPWTTGTIHMYVNVPPVRDRRLLHSFPRWPRPDRKVFVSQG